MMAAPSSEQSSQTPPVDWSLTKDQCVRIGWGLGWVIGITLAVLRATRGADDYLTGVQALLALVGFVLLGWTTGIFLKRFAPAETDDDTPEIGSTDETPEIGATFDLTVADEDPAEPGTESEDAGELARSGNAA